MTDTDRSAQRALLGGAISDAPARSRGSGGDDVDVVRRLLHGPVSGPAGTADAAMRRLFDRGWITVTGENDRWYAHVTPLGVRAAAEITPRMLNRTTSGDLDVPALCWADSPVGDEVRLVVLQDVFQFSDVTALIYEPDRDNVDGFDTRLVIRSGEAADAGDARDRWLSKDATDIPASAFGEGGGIVLSPKDRVTVRTVMATFANRHGPSLTVDLIDGAIASPVADAVRQAGPWILAVPPVLGRAIRLLAPGTQPNSDIEFLDWVSAGLPPIRLKCGYRNGAPAGDGALHKLLVVGDEVITPGHPESASGTDTADGIRNACRAAAIALHSSGPIADLPIATHRDPNGNTRTMPLNQIERLEQVRTVLLAARWLRAGWSLADVAPLLRHGPGPEEAVPLLTGGVPAKRIAEWAGHDLDDCSRWVAHPGVPVELAQSLRRAGLDLPEVTRWAHRGVPAANLLEWSRLIAAGTVSEEQIPQWEELGVSPATHRKINRSDEANVLSPARCREWLDAGIPAQHVRVYEHAGASPADIAPYGEVLAKHEPWEIVSAMGLLADSEAQVPIGIIAAYLQAGHLPYTAVFLEGHRFPMTRAARRRAADSPYARYERKAAPPISWPDAAAVIRTGRSTKSLFTLPSLLTAPDVPLMGTRNNGPRITRLLAGRPAGYDAASRPWHVGVLYPAPYDPVHDLDELIGVVTREGHVACLMPGYFYLRSLIEALTDSGIHFVVPIVPDLDTDDESDLADEPDITVRFLRYRELRPLLEDTVPPGIRWSWPAWRD